MTTASRFRPIACSVSATACSTLFPPQRFDRAETKRTPRRVGGAEQPDAESEGEAPGEDAGREVRRHELGEPRPGREQPCRDDAEREAEGERKRRDAERLADDETGDPPARPTDGSEDP